jgi:hypothetical protein
MQATHLVTAYPDRDLLRITLTGFFGRGDVAAFDRARLAAHTRLTCGPNRHLTLVDVRDLKLQAQEIVGLFRAMITHPATRARRLAFVTGCSVVRMQVRRLIERDDIACFADPIAAEAWLTDRPELYARAG